MNRLLSVTSVGMALLALCPGTSYAAVDSRRGFIFGLGAGLAPLASVNAHLKPFASTFNAPVDETSAGFGYQLVIGYGFSDHDWLVYEGNVLSRHSEAWDLRVDQGFNGASWYHAFGSRGEAWVGALGLGAYITGHAPFFRIYIGPPTQFPVGPPSEIGFGWLVGAGRQLNPKWTAMAYLSGGSVQDSRAKYDLYHASLLLHYIWD